MSIFIVHMPWRIEKEKEVALRKNNNAYLKYDETLPSLANQRGESIANEYTHLLIQ